jgi:hypothetical protein
LRIRISDETVFAQVQSITNRQPAAQQNNRAQELKQLTGLLLRDIAMESMGVVSEVSLIKTYTSQNFAGAEESRLVVTHAVLDRVCKVSRVRERHIHACRVVKPEGGVEEIMLRLFSVVRCVCDNGATQFGLLVQRLKPERLASNESAQPPFEKHAVDRIANHGFTVIPMNTILSLTDRYSSVDPPSTTSASTAPACSVWVLPSRLPNPHLRSSTGL